MFKYNLSDKVWVIFYGKITQGRIVSRILVENNNNKEDWMNIFGSERIAYSIHCTTKNIGDTREYSENNVFLSKEELIEFLLNDDNNIKVEEVFSNE